MTQDLELNYRNHLLEHMTEEQASLVMNLITIDDILAPHAKEVIIWEHPELGTVVDLIDKLDQVVSSINVEEL